jgi:8-oxo-dGTP pyrophosphatase MutT (NUDIX family)
MRRQRATAIVISGDGRVLLVRDRGRHRYSLPGGGQRHGESIERAAARELFEELGMRAVSVHRVPAADFRGTVSDHRACLVQAAGRPYIRSRHELDDYIWWNMRDRVPTYGHVQGILSRLY